MSTLSAPTPLPATPEHPASSRPHPHPAGGSSTTTARVLPFPVPAAPRDEDGSLVTEYGLLAVVAATIAGVIISWASNGALVTLFNALLRHARSLVGA
jgi:Flp pilus assembly pilin Flp